MTPRFDSRGLTKQVDIIKGHYSHPEVTWRPPEASWRPPEATRGCSEGEIWIHSKLGLVTPRFDSRGLTKQVDIIKGHYSHPEVTWRPPEASWRPPEATRGCSEGEIWIHSKLGLVTPRFDSRGLTKQLDIFKGHFSHPEVTWRPPEASWRPPEAAQKVKFESIQKVGLWHLVSTVVG